MRRVYLFILIILLMCTCTIDAKEKGVLDLRNKIYNKLDQIEKKYIYTLSLKERKKAVHLMEQVVDLLDKLVESKGKNSGIYVDNIDDVKFTILLNLLRKTDDFEKQRDILEITSIAKRFTVGQIIKVAKCIREKRDRFTAIEILSERISNPRDLSRLFEYMRNDNMIVQEEESKPEPVYTSGVISNKNFRGLLRTLKKATFYRRQRSILKTAAKTNYFTVEQLLEILEVIAFSDDKVDAVRIFLPKISNRNNLYKLNDYFDCTTVEDDIEDLLEDMYDIDD